VSRWDAGSCCRSRASAALKTARLCALSPTSRIALLQGKTSLNPLNVADPRFSLDANRPPTPGDRGVPSTLVGADAEGEANGSDRTRGHSIDNRNLGAPCQGWPNP